jgi:hypothetical protein
VLRNCIADEAKNRAVNSGFSGATEPDFALFALRWIARRDRRRDGKRTKTREQTRHLNSDFLLLSSLPGAHRVVQSTGATPSERRNAKLEVQRKTWHGLRVRACGVRAQRARVFVVVGALPPFSSNNFLRRKIAKDESI